MNTQKFVFVSTDGREPQERRELTREEAAKLADRVYRPADWHLDNLAAGKCECLSVEGGMLERAK